MTSQTDWAKGCLTNAYHTTQCHHLLQVLFFFLSLRMLKLNYKPLEPAWESKTLKGSLIWRTGADPKQKQNIEYCSVWENNINSPLREACILFYQFSLTHDLPADLGQPPLIKTKQGFCSKLREYWMKSIYDGCSEPVVCTELRASLWISLRAHHSSL